jgi:uncharacterized delta-60 repeat protein
VWSPEWMRIAGAYAGAVLLLVACGGDPAAATIVRIDDESAGDNCPRGGHAVHVGADDDGDGQLADDEIDSTSYLCDVQVGDVSGVTAVAAGDSVYLAWQNPRGSAFGGVTVRRSTEGFAVSPFAGDHVYEGIAENAVDGGLTAGTEYFYRIFAHDGAGHFSSGADVRAMPLPAGSFDTSLLGTGVAALPLVHDFAGANALVVDERGRSLVVGSEGTTEGVPYGVTARLTVDGGLDPGWAGGQPTFSSLVDWNAAAIDSAGRVLLAGGTAPPPRDLLLARFLPDGRPDPEFGDGGVLVVDRGASETIVGIAIDFSDGLAVIGLQGNAMLVSRVLSTGVVDTAFGDAGFVTIAELPGGATPYVVPSRVRVDETTILVAGLGADADGGTDAALWRFQAGGDPDPSFSDDGLVTVPGIGGDTLASGYGLAVDLTERIVLCGTARAGDELHMACWRFDRAGIPDAGFGDGGAVLFGGAADVLASRASDVALDLDGWIVVAGAAEREPGIEDLAVWRFAEDGTVDGGFGQGGITRFASALLGASSAADLAFDPWGRIVVAGSLGRSFETRMAVWRIAP